MVRKLKADLHTHTSEDKKENIRYSALELIDLASQKGFDVLSITNHDLVTYSEELKEYALKKGVLLIPGVEATIQGKHILLYNLPDYDQENIKTFEDLKRYKKDDILIIAPHPFFPSPTALRSLFQEAMPILDGLEYCHHYLKKLNFNRKAVEKAPEMNLPLIGCSDTHLFSQFTTTYSLIESDKEINAVIRAVKEKRVEVVTNPLSLAQTVKVWLELFRQSPIVVSMAIVWALIYMLFRL